MNLYLDCYDYQRAPTGIDTSSLVGNQGRIAGCAVGATSLPLLSPLTGKLNPYDQVYLFDGSSSEMVTVGSAGATNGDETIPVSATQFAHSAGIAFCTDGTSGSLATAIINASDVVENICKQPLLFASYSETYQLQTMHTSIDSLGNLNIRTPRKPVVALSSASFTSDVITGQALSVATVKYTGQLISIVNAGLLRTSQGFIDITYTAGFQYAQLPARIKQACTWLASDLLADIINPYGVALEEQGKIRTQYRLMHETDKTKMYLRAEEALKEYTVKVY